ncbi:unnamed protein product, partial [Closterium sp. NIES-54]
MGVALHLLIIPASHWHPHMGLAFSHAPPSPPLSPPSPFPSFHADLPLSLSPSPSLFHPLPPPPELGTKARPFANISSRIPYSFPASFSLFTPSVSPPLSPPPRSWAPRRGHSPTSQECAGAAASRSHGAASEWLSGAEWGGEGGLGLSGGKAGGGLDGSRAGGGPVASGECRKGLSGHRRACCGLVKGADTDLRDAGVGVVGITSYIPLPQFPSSLPHFPLFFLSLPPSLSFRPPASPTHTTHPVLSLSLHASLTPHSHRPRPPLSAPRR